MHRSNVMRKFSLISIAALVALPALFSEGCTNDSSDVLAPYGAQRPLFFTRITQNAYPDVQWLGGRAAAIGVNKGTKAALDQTLVWLQTGPADTITSYVTVGRKSDRNRILALGGTPADSLDADTVYTFWVATRAAVDAQLDQTNSTVNAFTFVDTTLTATYWLRGQSGGEGGTANPIVRIRIRREQTVTGDRFSIVWTPGTSAFRNLGLRAGSTGGYDNLLWLVSTPTGTTDNIASPVILGVPPPNVTEGNPYVPGSMASGTVYTIWMTNRNWVGTFNLTSRGYAWFRFTLPD
jgi:hypothetical protein